MNKIEDRQEEIRNLLSIKEKMSVNALAEYFNVTGATIRTDIRSMERNQEITRSSGMVSLTKPYVVNLNVKDKIFINAEQKEKIGAHAASIIRERDSIIMTSGTTIEALSRHICPTIQVNILTASISVALALVQNGLTDIYLLGGRIQTTSLSVRNTYSLQGLENVHATKLFFSCDGFDISTGVVTATLEEAILTKEMMKVADQIILLADSSKLGKTGFGHICNLKDVDILITDDDIPQKTLEVIENLGIHVEIV